MATILVIDDRPTNREPLLTLLGYAGHRVLEAREGEEGLEIARGEHPDLIITDIVMPTMDGYEFARQVRADPTISESQIIFYTSSYIVAETRRLAEACGVSIVISKPIEPQELLNTVQIALDGKRKPVIPPASEDFHREHMRLLTDTLAKKVEELEAEVIERKRVAEALRDREELFRSAFQYSPAGMCITSLDGKLQTINQSLANMLGFSAGELVGRHFNDITYSEDLEIGQDAANRLISGEVQNVAFEKRYLHKNGEPVGVYVNSTLLRDSSGKPLHFVTQILDITERKRAEEKLRQSEENFSKAFDSSPTALMITRRADGKYLEMNRAYTNIVGYERSELLGRLTTEFNIFINPDQRKEIVSQLVASGSLYNYEAQIQNKLGELRTVLASLEMIKFNGEDCILSTIVDITERKRAEEQAQLQIQRLRSLRAIDVAISSSFNLDLTLDILLNQVKTQLNVDAAAVLLFQPAPRTLIYGAGRGFRTSDIRGARVRLGEGYAGKAVMERHTIHIPNMMENADKLPANFVSMLKEEGFVDYYCVPLIVKGEVKGVLEIFHRSMLESDPEWLDFLETLAGQAAIAIEDSTLFENLQQSNQELFQAYDATIEGWSHALDLRDKETEGHTQRVTELTIQLAHKFGFSGEQLVSIRRGALLHDIGKMGVPDSILLKPSGLTDEEWETMRRHPTFAFEMLSRISYLKYSLDIPYCHHEKWDGTGYPRGLKGEIIPLAARVFAVVDVWDALRSDRPYRKGWTSEKTIEYIRGQSGIHFDPKVVEYFLSIIESSAD